MKKKINLISKINKIKLIPLIYNNLLKITKENQNNLIKRL
jgi:hypothetical protein